MRGKTFTMFVLIGVMFCFVFPAWSEPIKPLIFYSKVEKGMGNKNYTLRFSLWDAETGGNMVWEEEKTLTTKKSTINTLLGDVNPIDGVDFSQQLWVQVEKKLADETYVPLGEREQLSVSGVPYALWAMTPAGPQGLKGDKGDKGDTGSQGPKGDKGDTGATGPQGAAGPIGPQGVQGPGGPEGFQGPAGPQGPQGNDGPPGPLNPNVITQDLPLANTAVGVHAFSSSSTGTYNTAMGYNALSSNTTGNGNVAMGREALHSNTEGDGNTALGYAALLLNKTGNYNTATGFGVLGLNTTGFYNTATGYEALSSNTTGSGNIAVGVGALKDNTEGDGNTAMGFNALGDNTTGEDNAAMGESALHSNTTGSRNVAMGTEALLFNETGWNNTAIGYGALRFFNTTGGDNTAVGREALWDSTGQSNTAIGSGAGSFATTGEYNIYIGADVHGEAVDDHVIRIGSNQTATYIAGINGSGVLPGGIAVFVDSDGRLGTSVSSRRFKEDIKDMGEASRIKLRPVTFLYKSDIDKGHRALQYGLIAEEVAEVYPELVAYGKDGEPISVQYHELSPMLLNEVQKQSEQIKQLNQALNDREARLEKLERLLEAFKERVEAMQSPTRPIAFK